jgi:hypothetical protein
MWITAVAITLILLSASHFYSSVSAFSFSLQSVIHHQNNIFSKKQDGGSDSNSNGIGISSSNPNTKGSDNSDNEGNSNTDIDMKNNQRTNSPTDTGSHITGGRQQQVTGENIPPIVTAPAATPSTTCEQGSNCTDRQGLSDRDRSSITSNASTSGQNNNIPFVLPFP